MTSLNVGIKIGYEVTNYFLKSVEFNAFPGCSSEEAGQELTWRSGSCARSFFELLTAANEQLVVPRHQSCTLTDLASGVELRVSLFDFCGIFTKNATN